MPLTPRAIWKRTWALFLTLALATLTLTRSGALSAQEAQKPFEPEVGQPGKDVVWVPTPPELVEKMMDLAQVTTQDFVMDLGSGDGRNIIAAAKRGARAVGVEYNPDMVGLSERLAKAAGVSDRAHFVRGDMYQADISKATVMAIFLLPSNMLQLRSKFFALAPGSRIVSNTFRIEGWTADKSETVGGDCTAWCEAILWIVPAKVDGAWRGEGAELTLKQDFQMVSGSMTLGGRAMNVTGRLTGRDIVLTANGQEYKGTAADDAIQLSASGTTIRLSRATP